MILRSVMRTIENGVLGTGHTFMYEASLSPDVTIEIIHHVTRVDGHLCQCWQFRRVNGGICGPWMGKFASAQEAAIAA